MSVSFLLRLCATNLWKYASDPIQSKLSPVLRGSLLIPKTNPRLMSWVILVQYRSLCTHLACRLVLGAYLAFPHCLRLPGLRAFGASADDWRAFGAPPPFSRVYSPHPRGNDLFRSALRARPACTPIRRMHLCHETIFS